MKTTVANFLTIINNSRWSYVAPWVKEITESHGYDENQTVPVEELLCYAESATAYETSEEQKAFLNYISNALKIIEMN